MRKRAFKTGRGSLIPNQKQRKEAGSDRQEKSSMYLSMLFGLITEAAVQRAAARQARGHRPAKSAPAALAALNDHHLRDLGYVRERFVRARKHIMWM